jgi:predicted DNA-binding protein with PD1-like motif
MRSKLLAEDEERTYAVVFETGDEVSSGLASFARESRLGAARLAAIGAFARATLGYFDIDRKEYRRIPVDEQVEVLSLIGDVTLKDGEPQVHAHVVLGKSDGTALGGHLLEAVVRPTLEVVLVESPGHLRRRYDEATGLALIDLDLAP